MSNSPLDADDSDRRLDARIERGALRGSSLDSYPPTVHPLEDTEFHIRPVVAVATRRGGIARAAGTVRGFDSRRLHAFTSLLTYQSAQGQWDGSFPFGASGQVDLIVDDTQDRKFIVAAKPVSSGMSLPRWKAFVVRVQRQVCHGLRSFRASSLGGVPAREFVNSCPEYDVITLAALHNGRGYLLNYLSPPSSSAASGCRIYETGRRAFDFTQK